MEKNNPGQKILALILAFVMVGVCTSIVVGGIDKIDSHKLKGEVSQEVELGQIDNFTPIKLEGWGNAWYTQPEFDGDDMPMDALVEVENIDFGVKKSIAPRLGSTVLGTASTNKNPVKSLHTSKALDGRDLLLRSHSTVLEWWNPDGSAWEGLATGFTSGKDFTFVDGMTSSETANYTYYANGVEDIGRFRIAFGSLATTTGATTTLNSVTGS